MLVVKEPVEDQIKTTSVIFGLVLIMGGFIFWKIVDLSNKIEMTKQESKEDFLLFTDDLRKTQKRVIDMESINGETNNQIEKVLGEIVTSKKLVAEAVESMAALKAQVKKISDGQLKASKSDAEFRKTQQTLTAALNKLESSAAELNRLKNESKEMNQTITDLTSEIENLKSQMNLSSEQPTSTNTATKKPWWKFWGK